MESITKIEIPGHGGLNKYYSDPRHFVAQCLRRKMLHRGRAVGGNAISRFTDSISIPVPSKMDLCPSTCQG